MKTCKWCGVEKPLQEFRKLSRSFDGHDPVCTKCKKHRHKTVYSKVVGYQEKQRGHYLKYKYGISWQDLLDMYNHQNGLCEICSNPIRIWDGLGIQGGQDICCIDHSHTTGKIRGLLCNSCNLGIGYFKDDLQVVKSSIKYLEKHNENICD